MRKLQIQTGCLVMAIPHFSSISSVVDTNLLTQVDNGVSKKELPKTRRLLLPSLQMKPCGARNRSGNVF